MNNETETIRLTQMSRNSGCGCKIAPAVLQAILSGDGTPQRFAGLLVGYENSDDAAVIRIPGSNELLISTVDFFTPVVDDPFTFGRIAAANALSDVYAMGGQPLLATAILGFPVDKIPVESARQILDGGRAACREAGIPLAGGHSIDSVEPFFGLSVNGTVREAHLKKNSTARPGDLLFLTKPLGSGIFSSAMKRDQATPEDLKTAAHWMTQLNRVGRGLGMLPGVHALTDVTGFGLLGHLIEMAEGSRCTAELSYAAVPLMEGTEKFTARFIFPDQVYRNWNAYEKRVSGISGPEFITLCDPQTNGGLLAAVDPESADQFVALMKSEGIQPALIPIGVMREAGKTVVELK